MVEPISPRLTSRMDKVPIECVYTPRHLVAGMGLSELDSYIRSTFNVSDIIISPCFDSPVTLHDGRTLDERRFADILRADAARLESLKSSESVSGGKREGERRPVLQQVTGATPQLGWCGLGVETLTVAQDGSLLPCYALLQEPSRWTLRTVASDPASTTAEAASIQERLDGADPRKLASEILFEFIDNLCKGIIHNEQSRKTVAPLGLALFVWIVLMNTMDLLPVDLLPWIWQHVTGNHHALLRVVPTADLNITLGMSIGVLLTCFMFNVKIKGLGGWIHELFAAPFGIWLAPFNFILNLVEFSSKTISHGNYEIGRASCRERV